MPDPFYWTEADKARVDAAALSMVDEIDEHRRECIRCNGNIPGCPEFGRIVDEAHKVSSAVGAESFARYCRSMELKWRQQL